MGSSCGRVCKCNVESKIQPQVKCQNSEAFNILSGESAMAPKPLHKFFSRSLFFKFVNGISLETLDFALDCSNEEILSCIRHLIQVSYKLSKCILQPNLSEANEVGKLFSIINKIMEHYIKDVPLMPELVKQASELFYNYIESIYSIIGLHDKQNLWWKVYKPVEYFTMIKKRVLKCYTPIILKAKSQNSVANGSQNSISRSKEISVSRGSISSQKSVHRSRSLKKSQKLSALISLNNEISPKPSIKNDSFSTQHQNQMSISTNTLMPNHSSSKMIGDNSKSNYSSSNILSRGRISSKKQVSFKIEYSLVPEEHTIEEESKMIVQNDRNNLGSSLNLSKLPSSILKKNGDCSISISECPNKISDFDEFKEMESPEESFEKSVQ